jgi:Protein of unknown function (DUF4058)
VLSPTYKRRGPDREQYLAKRGNLLRGLVHLVEIDLLRGGPRLPFEEAPESDYYIMVSRSEERPKAEFWPVQLRERLPEVPVPLRQPWPDVRLDLQQVLDTVYDRAGYKKFIYRGSPQPPLNADAAAWAAGLLAAPAPPPAEGATGNG